jgi:hypothetical protein
MIKVVVKRLLCNLIFSSALLLGLPAIASAHILATDGSMGAILHIDPEDYPVVNQPQDLIFYFSDSSGNFRTQNCTCSLTISEGGSQIFHSALPSTTSTSAKLPYTFKKADVYGLAVSGQPKNGSFQPFNLTYNIRVDTHVPGESSGNYAPSNLPAATYQKKVGTYFGVLIAAALILIALSGYLFYGSYNKSKKGKK